MQPMHANPYGDDLGSRDPIEALAETPSKSASSSSAGATITSSARMPPASGAPGKILIHLAQTEFALTTRARFALSTPDYVAQGFDQDDWMPIDEAAQARTALDAYGALRRLNLEMWTRLTSEQRDRPFSHPEYGELTVGWIMAQMAGHDIHHLKQLERIK